MRWWCDATSVRAGGQRACRYRAIAEADQVVGIVLRTQRDEDSARAFAVLATDCRRPTPDEVPGATRTQRRRHRKSGPDTKPIERSHMPTLDRLRPRRGRQLIRTGQRASAGVELARAVQRGHIVLPGTPPVANPHARARTVAATFDWRADGLRVVA